MPIPDYQSCMLPLLRFSATGAEHALKEAVAALAEEFRLTDEERSEYLPSGQQTVIQNRVAWARTYMKKAGLLSTPRRGFLLITERGRAVLRENPAAIDVTYLERFPEFVDFKTLRHEKAEETAIVSQESANDIACKLGSSVELEGGFFVRRRTAFRDCYSISPSPASTGARLLSKSFS
ncbi:MAG: winged helix-turn-helix domain-containing protein [Opitutaceae bacterium]|nr:winged helix-turn-helix domain-containing protein [Opitutaceae bacterium]